MDRYYFSGTINQFQKCETPVFTSITMPAKHCASYTFDHLLVSRLSLTTGSRG